jgi:hypothetical protein
MFNCSSKDEPRVAEMYLLLGGWQKQDAVLLILKSAGVTESTLKLEPEYTQTYCYWFSCVSTAC